MNNNDNLIIINRQTPRQMEQFVQHLDEDIQHTPYTETHYLKLGTIHIRIINHTPELTRYIHTMFACSMTADTPSQYQATIQIWQPTLPQNQQATIRMLIDQRYSDTQPVATINDSQQKIEAYDITTQTYYLGITHTEPELLALEGHLAVRTIYRILKPRPDMTLVHGACIGYDGRGALLCARGNRGKSTLTVLAMLMGMEYVSDDYLTLTHTNHHLYADPIYSIITLSPRMYNEMYDQLEQCRFISNNWNKTKYILDISSHHDTFRYHYPIHMCLFPEIVDDPEPSIQPCTPADKGRAITHLVHSTTTQMDDNHDPANVMKLIGMLKQQPFYKLNLCHDIRKNVEFLKEFMKNN